MDIFLLHFG